MTRVVSSRARPPQDPFHRQREVVIPQPVEDPAEVPEGCFVRLQEGLLRGMGNQSTCGKGRDHPSPKNTDQISPAPFPAGLTESFDFHTLSLITCFPC